MGKFISEERCKPDVVKRLAGCLALAASLILSASCTSMKVPNFDSIKFPDFREEAENIGDYPKAEDAPGAPVDVRSDDQWDSAAKSIMQKSNSIQLSNDGGQPRSQQDIERDLDALSARAQEYKLDDPQ